MHIHRYTYGTHTDTAHAHAKHTHTHTHTHTHIAIGTRVNIHASCIREAGSVREEGREKKKRRSGWGKLREREPYAYQNRA
jgi:hypothetical protein